jgi:primosomal protein N' (replication factor Y)
LGYPPFGQLLRLEYRHPELLEAEKATNLLALRIKEWIATENHKATSLIGPVPCFFAKINGLYRWQIILRGPDPVALLQGRIPVGWRVEVQPVSLL